MTKNNKVKMLTKTEVYNKTDDNYRRTIDLLDQLHYHNKNGGVPIILLDEFKNHFHNHVLPLYSPGGIYHVPTKHKGLRLDNIEDLEEKGKNVN